MLTKIFSFVLSVILAFNAGIMSVDGYSGKKAERIVSKLSLTEKIGQMLMPAFRQFDGSDVTEMKDGIAKAVAEYGFGGIILFAENCVGTEQTLRLTDAYKDAAKKSSSGIPPLISVDQEGGTICRLGTGCATCGNMALGALRNPAETEQSARIIASELAAVGISVDFAPDADLNCNPSNPVIGVRSFSSEPTVAATMISSFISGCHKENIATAAKHFPGHGDTDTDSHTGLPRINKSFDTLAATELIPFRAAVSAKTDIVMTAHIQFPAIETQTAVSKKDGRSIYLPATLSKTIVTGILREKLGFGGVVTTDAMNMDAIADNFGPSEAAVLAINAGVDLLLMPVTVTSSSRISAFGDYIGNIAAAVKDGRIPEKRITESAERIVRLKLRRNIITNDTIDTIRSFIPQKTRVAKARSVVGSKEHHDAEFETACKAVTIIRNNFVLPLAKGKKTVVFYPYEGEYNSVAYAAKLTGEDISAYCYRYASPGDHAESIAQADHIVVATEMYSANYLTGWQAAFADSVIEKAHSLGKKVTVLSLNLPYDVARYNSADALAACYGAKEMPEIPSVYDGETKSYGVNIPAGICALFGYAEPEGVLPVDIPALDGNYRYTRNTLYRQGYGIKY